MIFSRIVFVLPLLKSNYQGHLDFGAHSVYYPSVLMFLIKLAERFTYFEKTRGVLRIMSVLDGAFCEHG